MEVASEFLQLTVPEKLFEESDHPKRMGGAIVNGAAVFDDSGLLDVHEGGIPPLCSRNRHGDHAKRQHPRQIIHSLIVTERKTAD